MSMLAAAARRMIQRRSTSRFSRCRVEMATGAIVLIALHSVIGTEISVNVAEITSMYEARGDADKIVVKGARCIINLSDGKFASVIETCGDVRRKIEDMK